MDEVRLDPQQAPARAELLLGAGFGQEARGRPIHGRLESEDDGDGEPGPRVKIGAVRTRRLAASEGTARPSGSAYGNPLRGTRDIAPAVPIGAPVIARVDVPDARGWRVYRAAPNGAVIYDGWIEHDPANPELALAELRAAAAASPAAALRRAVERQPGHASGEAIARWLAGQETERPGGPAKPRSRAARRRWRRALARRGGRPCRPHLHSPHHRSRRARNLAALLRQNALVTAAHPDPSRPVPILGAPRHQPAWIAVDPSTATTHLDPP